MKTIETLLTVDETGTATLKLPADVTPGRHKVVMVIEEPRIAGQSLSFPTHDVGPWPFGPNETFRREEIYGDDGR